MQRILVCVKQVPDTTEVKLDENHSLVRDFVAQVINPADQSALECALALKEQTGASITVMSMGKPSAAGMLQELAGRGADELLLLTDSAFAGADTLATARTLCAAIEATGPYDLLLLGRRAIDGETGQVGPALAALLDIPMITNAIDFEWDAEQGALCTQLTERGHRQWKPTSMPMLVAFCEWSKPLRLPSLLGIRRAKDKTVQTLGLVELGLSKEECGLRGSPTRVTHVHKRASGIRQCDRISVDALFEKGVLG